jgi:hypothetical protein
MGRRYTFFPEILVSGGLFYFSLIFFKTPLLMFSILFFASWITYIPTGSLKLTLSAPVIFLLCLFTGMKPFVDKEKGLLILTHRDYVLYDKKEKHILFGNIIID